MARQPVMKLVSPNHRTPEQFAALIKEKWQDQVKSIIEVGLLLETAKEELAHGEWGKMVRDHLPFNDATARKLLAIAGDERLSDRSHENDLPAVWTTLYVLTQLSDEAFEAALASGKIHPGMTRKDATALLPPKEKKKKAEPTSVDPIGDKLFHLQELIERSLEDIKESERAAFISSLRQVIDQIEDV